MKKVTYLLKLICICLCLVFSFYISLPYSTIIESPVLAKPNNTSMGNCVWMHIDTFFYQNNAQINNFANTLKINKIKTVFILAKNIDGTVTYPSQVGIKCYTKDYMKNFIDLMKSNHIKVIFYFPINTDPAWIKGNLGDISYQAGTRGSKIPAPDPAKKLVNLTSKKYKNYIVELIKEAIKKYSIDGVQLDYIRYTNGLSGFSKEELLLANQRNISVSKIIELTYQTFLDPGDWKTILNKYDESDPDVLAWAKLREDIIFDFTQYIVTSIKTKNLEIGTSLVSSGANEKAYTAIHFGQNWEKMSSILNFVTPMAYHGSRSDVKKFVEEICIGALSKINASCKISIGIQANSTTTEKMMEAIQSVNKFNLGFVLFRVGSFAFSSFDFYPINQEQVLLKILLFNNVEEKQLKGIEIKNTGNVLSILNCPLSCEVLSQDETKIKLLLTNPLSNGEFLSIDLVLNWNFEKNKTILSPTIILSDEKNEFPTLNVSFFVMDQMVVDLHNQIVLYDKIILDKQLIKIENDKTWISTDGLKNVLGFKVKKHPDSIEITNKNTRFVIYQIHKKGQIFIRNSNFWISDPLFFNQEGYLPLTELMKLFRIQVSFNQNEKKVFCTLLNRENPSSIYGQWNQCSILELFIADASEVMIDFEDFISTSHYIKSFENHLLGRSLRVILKKGNYSVEEIENLIHLVTEEKSNLLLPDTFTYFLTPDTEWKKIPSYREVLTLKKEISNSMGKQGYKTNLVISKGESFQQGTSGIIYFEMDRQNILDKIEIIQNESKNIRNLYSLKGLKF